MTTAAQVNFTVHNIYVKDISFEAPNSPQVFTLDWKPKLDFNIEMNRTNLEEALYEVVLKVTVSVAIELGTDANAKSEKQTAFLVEIKQAGIFMLQGVTDQAQIDYILATTAPTILFPYARQVIANLVMQGGFPQLIVPPMNFEAMYQQHLSEQTTAQEPALA